MKYIYNFILLFLILLISCDGDKSPLEPNHPMSFITNALTEYIVGAEPSSDFGIEFIVESPLNSKIKSNQNWCKIEIDKNKKLNVKLVVDDNVTNKERVARVVISSPEIENAFLILVKQRALAFEMTNLEDAFTPEGGEYDVFIGSNDSWTIECDVDWVNLSTASGESTDGLSPAIVKLVVGPNNDGIVRSANFILKSSSGKEFTKEVYQNEPWDTRVRIGDEGVQFDESRFDPTYALFPQMIEWKTAGRTVGIPLLNEQISNIDKTFGPENTVEEINAYLEAGDKYQKRIILLKAGEYTIDKSIRLYSQDVLIGERKDGVILKLSGDGAISMFNENNIGLRNLTIKGAWSDKDPDPTDMSETLPSEKEKHQTVSMSRTKESYVDNVRIINSASHPIIISGNVDNNGEGSHNTIRDVEIDGAYNKGGGYQGYFHIGGAYNLITGCTVTNIRHISMQDPTSAYNVFYKNDVHQEFSFHVNDGGNNLVERNNITLPKYMSKSYCAIMGPWSSQHQVGGKNFIYRNKCLELNRDNNKPWSDEELYIGPWEVKPSDVYNNFRVTEGYPKPEGRTLYPVILK